MQGNKKNDAEARDIATRGRELAEKVVQLKLEIAVECDEIQARVLRLTAKRTELERVQREVIEFARSARRLSRGGW